MIDITGPDDNTWTIFSHIPVGYGFVSKDDQGEEMELWVKVNGDQAFSLKRKRVYPLNHSLPVKPARISVRWELCDLGIEKPEHTGRVHPPKGAAVIRIDDRVIDD